MKTDLVLALIIIIYVEGLIALAFVLIFTKIFGFTL